MEVEGMGLEVVLFWLGELGDGRFGYEEEELGEIVMVLRRW